MKSVCRQTGLSPHVIRVWERRYGAVTPVRTPTNRRVYREEDVERLRLLHQATELGHAISQASKLTNEELQGLLQNASPTNRATPIAADLLPSNRGQELVTRALLAVRAMDIKSVDAVLREAVVTLGTQGLLTQVAAPLAQQVGELWQHGTLTSAHEHFLSAALRTFLARHSRQYSVPPSAPKIIVGTPAGQVHELGAAIVAAAASNLGWHVIYLGTSLPAAELAGIAREQDARAIALSIVYPEDDPTLPGELHALRDLTPSDVEILVGGRAAHAYASTLVGIRARIAHHLEDLFPALETIRSLTLQNGFKSAS